MKKFILQLTLLVLLVTISSAQTPPLVFSAKGDFKIVQFTDVHYAQNKKSEVAIQLINEVLDAEHPDLVVFTGDVIWAKPALKGLDEVLATVIERKIPWAYVLGNHDDEFDMSRKQLIDYASKMPYSLTIHGDESLSGAGNYILEVKNNRGDQTQALLYFFDSGAYTPIKDLGKYNWFGYDLIDWYRNKSKAYTAGNNGTPYPALAFFHIPLAEYPLMTTTKKSHIIGKHKEDECNGKLNSGMFTAMREMGDVMGTFVGHDHDNDYIGDYYGIALAYGRYSGGKTVYNNLGKNGCRVITLTEGQKEFSTYIRLLGGEILYPVKYPNTFAKTN